MHKHTLFWTVSDLRDRIRQISFPEYQREPSIWQRGAKQKLIDSIVRQFDIASIYLYDNGDGTWDCVDGRQRIGAIMSFLDSNDADTEDAGFPYKVMNEIYDDERDHAFTPLKDRTFSEITTLASGGDRTAQSFVKALEGYAFTVVELSAAARAEEFNLQFTRLNLGAIINSGEKLHAMVGELRDICFGKLAANPFLASIDIPTRRYAREQLAAQIAAQIITIENARKTGRAREFARVRHMDLQKLFKDNTEVRAETRNWLDRVEEVMNLLAVHSESLPPLRSRAIVLSIVLLAYERNLSDPAHAKLIADFAKLFVGRLRWLVSEVSGGHGAEESYLYLLEFQKHLTQASAEKPAVQTRAKCLEDSFDYWFANGRVLRGDKEYSENHPGSQPNVL